MTEAWDVIVIGGGQSGLACGYYLRRTGLKYLILDNQEQCGGAWQQTWDSLTLFSPAEHSSLPGWLMPKSENLFPNRGEVIDYLCQYEKRYNFPVERPVEVQKVTKENDIFKIETDKKTFYSKAVISATGTWKAAFIPNVSGMEKFKGIQIHSAAYKTPEIFKNKKVLVVGEGNSGAQILAEVSKATETKWATQKHPEFLPDDVDGFYLFNLASAKYKAEKEGKTFDPAQYNLGNIVMVPSVKEARQRDVLHSAGKFTALYEDGVVWEDGKKENFDAIIWCTGFGYNTKHLEPLVETDARGKIKTKNTKAENINGLWLVGYGGWTGYASATIIGVGRTARQTVKEIEDFLKSKNEII